MKGQTSVPTYHVVLIGIDDYPPGYRNLAGCVNDIDAIEWLLLEPPGIGIPPDQIRIARLAASVPGRPSRSRLQAETLAPTKANVIGALKALAGPLVEPSDRVLIYYSGHGDEKLWTGSSVWHEALVPHNGRAIEYLFDVEINALIGAIAARTSDLTIVLDSCHSAGATRDLTDIQAEGSVRSLGSGLTAVAPPDLAELGLGGGKRTGQDKGSPLLQAVDPDYLVVVACQSDEKAGEGARPLTQPSHGVFTRSLLGALADREAPQLAGLRWADIWPELVAGAAERNAQLRQSTQHPWMIGRSERRVFGGPWEKMDAGYRVNRRPDGAYEVGAGRLMGVTDGAEIAVYGPEPRLFPALDSPANQPVGLLRVSEAGPSSAVATAVGAGFELPDGVRGRMVKPGESQALRVTLKQADAGLGAQLRQSPLLEVVSSTDPNADVEVMSQPGEGWIIGNDTEPRLATVPAGETAALRAVLEYYYRYSTLLRMAQNCNDPQLSHQLSVRMLDCNDQEALAAMSPRRLADPRLSEAPRDQDRIYAIPAGFRFCVKVANASAYQLNVTLLNCSAGGLVQYLSDALLRKGASHVMWLDNTLGTPFEASPDEMPAAGGGVAARKFVTDRVIAIGTTRPDVDLRYLWDGMDKTAQQVVDENLARRGSERGMRPTEKTSIAPAELWTATVTPVRILGGMS
jgi:hypothetical protein